MDETGNASFEDSEKLNRQLLSEAVKNEDVEKVRDLLQTTKVTDVNFEEDDGFFSRPLLHIAISRNNFKICQMLLNAGANIFDYDARGNRALMIAASTASADIVKLIIQNISYLPYAEIYINASNANGQTALMGAIGNSREVVEMLIKEKALLDITDQRGYTPLMQAASLGKTDIMMTLIKHGANYNLRNNKNETAMAIYRNCYFNTFYAHKHFSVNDELKSVLDTIRNEKQQQIDKLFKKAFKGAVRKLKNNKSLRTLLQRRHLLGAFIHRINTYEEAKQFYFEVAPLYAPSVSRFIRQQVLKKKLQNIRE